MTAPIQDSDYVTLRDTIRNKDKVKATNLILNNVDVNNCKRRCNTPLHWAIIQFDDLDIITMLLDKGADIHAKNHNHEKPLDLAIQNNRAKAALLLITKGALVGENLETLLLKAVQYNNYKIFKSLMDNRTQSNQNIDFDNLIENDISRRHPKILEHILPHCQFSKLSDKYIPRELVIQSHYKNCVKLLLKKNFTIHPTSHQDKDFVYGAVENGHLLIVLQLLKLGIDVNLVNINTGLNLLKIACLNKHCEIVENLLKHDAIINVTTPTNSKILLNKNNNLFSSMYNKNDLCGLTCLHIAVVNNDSKTAELLLRFGAKIIDDPTFFIITCNAVQYNCEEIVRMFLDRGVNINAIDSKRRTLLHFCVDSSDDTKDSKYNIAKLLLEKGAISQLRVPGNSFIFKAIKNEHRKIAKLFLNYNPDTQYISSHGDTSLHKAIEKNFDVKFIKTLLKLDTPVNVVNNFSLTPLIVACKTQLEHKLEIIMTLLKHNANVNYGCQTPLHFACKYKNDITSRKYKNNITTRIIKLLLENNANIEAVDEKNWTPLFEACYSNNYAAVKCLLDHHANANHTDLYNLTPLHIAVKYYNDNSKVIQILLKHNVNFHYIDKDGKSIIHFISENDRNAELIEFFVHTQVNFNSVDKKGNTPLHIGVENKCVNITKNLIKYGADINSLNKKKRTSLREAIESISDLQNQLEQFRRGQLSERMESDDNFHTIVGKINRCQEIIKILKTQVIKLKIAKLNVNKKNLNLVYNSDNNGDDEFFHQNNMNYKIDVLQLEVDCEQEIKRMKMKHIGTSMTTFYDLLKKNIYIISKFAQKKIIEEILKREVYDEKFPLYIDIVRSRLRDGKLRYTLMKSVKKCLIANINHRLPDNCIDALFSYLNIEEITVFIRALGVLDN